MPSTFGLPSRAATLGASSCACAWPAAVLQARSESAKRKAKAQSALATGRLALAAQGFAHYPPLSASATLREKKNPGELRSQNTRFREFCTCFGCDTKTGVFWLFFMIDLCSATSMESSRRGLLNDQAEHRPILKSNQNTHYSLCFGDRPMFSSSNGKFSPRPFE